MAWKCPNCNKIVPSDKSICECEQGKKVKDFIDYTEPSKVKIPWYHNLRISPGIVIFIVVLAIVTIFVTKWFNNYMGCEFWKGCTKEEINEKIKRFAVLAQKEDTEAGMRRLGDKLDSLCRTTLKSPYTVDALIEHIIDNDDLKYHYYIREAAIKSVRMLGGEEALAKISESSYELVQSIEDKENPPQYSGECIESIEESNCKHKDGKVLSCDVKIKCNNKIYDCYWGLYGHSSCTRYYSRSGDRYVETIQPKLLINPPNRYDFYYQVCNCK